MYKYYTNHICVNLIVVHGNASKQFVTADEFVSIARSNEGIIEPLLAFRRKIIENVVGISFWEKIADRIRIRNDDAKDRAISSTNDAKVDTFIDQNHHCNWFKRFGLNYHHGGIITPVNTLTGFAKLTMEAVAYDEKTQRTNRANSVWNVFENQFSYQRSQHNRHQNRQQKIDATRHQYSSTQQEFDSKHLNKIEEGVKRYG